MLRHREAFLQTVVPMRFSLADSESIGHLNIFMLTLLRQQGRLCPDVTILAHHLLPDACRSAFAQNTKSFNRLVITQKPFDAYCSWLRCLVPESSFLMRTLLKTPPLYDDLYHLAWDTQLDDGQKTELFLLLISGFLLAGKKSLADTLITPREAEAAFLRRSTDKAESPWVTLPSNPNEPLVLTSRREPYRMLMHPVCQSPLESILCKDESVLRTRRLPKGCTLRTCRIEAKPDPYGQVRDLRVAFFRSEDDCKPICSTIVSGDHLYVNALLDGQEAPQPVRILPRRVRQGSSSLEACPSSMDELLAFRDDKEIASYLSGPWVASFTPIPEEKGAVYLSGGRLCIPDCSQHIFTALKGLDRISDLVEAAYIDNHVLLLRRNGQVLSQFNDGRPVAANVLSLMGEDD